MQRGTGSLEESGSHRRLIETSAVRLPSVGLEGSDGSRFRLAVWGAALEGCVRAVIVEVGREIDELGLEVRGRPKEGTIQEFSSDGADQSLDKGMGERDIRDGFYFVDLEDAKIGLPLTELKQGIMVGAEVHGRA